MSSELTLVVFALLLVAIRSLNRRQQKQLDRGDRMSATRMATGTAEEVMASMADVASSSGGHQISVIPPGTVTWITPMNLTTVGYRFRAEVQPAGTGAHGEPVSEVRIGCRLRFGYADWGRGHRMARKLLEQLPGDPSPVHAPRPARPWRVPVGVVPACAVPAERISRRSPPPRTR